jgi:hypothetical protein
MQLIQVKYKREKNWRRIAIISLKYCEIKKNNYNFLKKTKLNNKESVLI